MATTISFPTVVSTNSITGSNLFADDGTNTTGAWNELHADIELSSFSSLSIPAGATINGIEVVVDGQGSSDAGDPEVAVYNGTSWSSNEVFSSDFGKTNTEYDPGWGSSSNLWGLTWNATTAAAIQVRVDSSTIGYRRQLYWDWVKVRITYTAAGASATVHTINTVAEANVATIKGVAHANIAEVNTVTFD
jgi:hypothetical protein